MQPRRAFTQIEYNQARFTYFRKTSAAAYHGKSGNLSYADGHAAARHWPANPVTDTNPDGLWLMQHATLPSDGTSWNSPVLP